MLSTRDIIKSWWLILLLLLLMPGILWAAAPAKDAAGAGEVFKGTGKPSPELVNDINRGVFETKCGKCHGLERSLSIKKTDRGWEKTVKKMMEKTSDWTREEGNIDLDDAKKVMRYLTSVRSAAGLKEYTKGESTKDKFERPEGAQRAKKPKNLSSLERSHVPYIKIPSGIVSGREYEIEVEVGRLAHPMLPEHHINYISLYKGDKLVGQVKINPGDRPQAKFKVSIEKGTKLRALTECNMHGLWEADVEPQAL